MTTSLVMLLVDVAMKTQVAAATNGLDLRSILLGAVISLAVVGLTIWGRQAIARFAARHATLETQRTEWRQVYPRLQHAIERHPRVPEPPS